MNDPGRSQPTPEGPTDPDLALIVERWYRLPEPIKAAVLALVQTASGKGAALGADSRLRIAEREDLQED